MIISLSIEILRESTNHILQYSTPETALHFNRAMNHAMQGGKRVRGLATVQSYMAFADREGINEDRMKLAAILGLIMEIVNINQYY